MNDIFNIIVGCANIIACVVSIISLIKVSQINGKLNSDNNKSKTENIGKKNKTQQITVDGDNKKNINQRMR